MDLPRFPVAILALCKGLGIVLSLAFGSIDTVKYGVRTYYYFDAHANTPPAFPLESAVVQFSHETKHCPTCPYVDMDGYLLDYGGKPIDVQQFLHEDKTPTPTLPLKIAYAAPFTLGPERTPTTLSTLKFGVLPAPTTTKPASTPFANTIIPPPEASKLESFLISCQNLFRHIIEIIYTRRIPISHPIKRQAWGIARIIACGAASMIFGTNLATATVKFVLHLLNFWKSHRPNDKGLGKVTLSQANVQLACGIACMIFGTRSVTATAKSLLHRLNFWKSHRPNDKGLGKVTSSQANVQLATKANQLLERLTDVAVRKFQHPSTLESAIQKLLVDYVDGEEAERAEWRTVERRRVFEETQTYIKEVLGKERVKMNRTANQEFKRLHQIHEDKLKASFERDVFAAANIEPSFGPSLRNAEAELRGRLGKITMDEGPREAIIRICKNVLYSFTYSMAIEESGPGRHVTRYLSIIDGQKDLIEALRLLHKYREKAFAENEDLVRSLCRYNNSGDLIVPDHQMRMDPYDKYSAKDDTFITSPLDGPTALSMKVSLSSARFQGNSDAYLESDPHWQRFVNSTAEKQAEQEERLACGDKEPNEDEIEWKNGIKDASVQESHTTPQSDDGAYPNEEAIKEQTSVKDASEQSHHDTPQGDDETCSNQSEVKGNSGTNDAGEEVHDDSPHNKNVHLKDGEVEGKTSMPSSAEFGNRSDADLDADPRWHMYLAMIIAEHEARDASGEEHPNEGKVEGKSGTNHAGEQNEHEGHSTSEDPETKPSPPSTPASPTEEISDPMATQEREESLAKWRKHRFLRHKLAIGRIRTAKLKLSHAAVAGAQDEPQPEALSKTARRDLERKRANAKEAEEAGETPQ